MPTAALKPRRDAEIAGQPAPGGSAEDALAPSPGLTDSPSARGADRRGPFRPQNLVSSRSRLNGEAIASAVRGIDIVAIAVAAWVAFDIANPAGVWASSVAMVAPVIAAAALLILSLRALNAYSFRAREPFARHLLKLSAACIGTGGFLLAILGAAHAPGTATQSLAVVCELCFASVYARHLVWWCGVRALRRSGRLTPTAVIVGATRSAERLIASALERRDIAILGVFDDRKGRAPDQIGGVPVLGDTGDMIGHRIMPYVDRVIITVAPGAKDRVSDITDRLRVLPNEVTLLLDDDQNPTAAMARLADMPLAQVSGARVDHGRAFAKRMQDIVITLASLIVVAPVMALIAVAVRLDSPGPIFFRQRRQGFNNEEIVVWKFRSMRHEARDERALRQVSYDDDRITRVGRFIRRTSLDELPQVLNILAGEMSLVGPRPHAPAMMTGDVQSSRLVAEYAHRHRMKPGLTGWAAIHGSRGPVDTPEQVRRRVALDIAYIERQSFWLDLYIMIMTLPCLVGDRQTAR